MSRKILLIQDDPLDATTIREALLNSSDESFQVEWVRCCSEGLELLTRTGGHKTDHLAAVLVDLRLPDSQGIETFDLLFRTAPQIPILVLCASQDEDIGRLAVERGAQEYLLKARLDSYWLPKAIRSMIERAANAEALFEEKERAQVTLNSIGDAVISTDLRGNVTYLNVVAERLTGWCQEEALGHSLADVFRVVDATTRKVFENPLALAIREDNTAGLTSNCLLIRRDRTDTDIESSAAPIHDRHGNVTGAVAVFHDVSAARALALRMSYLAQYDNVTDLPNRILFKDRLTQAMALAHRHHRKLAVLYLDVDRFKYINDSLGHAIGDRMLQAVARRLVACVRQSDTVSRQGGDEFVILLSEVENPADAGIVADKILQALRIPIRIDEHELNISVSTGIVTYPDDGAEAEDLLNNADFAMYHAKDSGRGNYQFFKPEMTVRAIQRQSIEADLRLALARNQFTLNYQPKVNLDTGVIVGVEALIRWRHPERGLVAPLDFIPTAEECGSIVPIGQWVLREACRQARCWLDAGLPPIRIAVNVSPIEIRATNFAARVQAILTETGLGATYLELELTETALMQDSKATSDVLQALKDIGVHLALDDFGTGYSSLTYLKRFPIDTLKIDRSFVQDVTTDSDGASIVSAVIGMGERLSLRVVAEGIETRDQLAFLQKQRCPFGQGYYFSRPVSAGDFRQIAAVGSVADALFVKHDHLAANARLS